MHIKIISTLKECYKQWIPVCSVLKMVIERFPLDLLAKDINENNPPQITNGFGGITLTYNVEKKDEVDKIVELVRNAGGTIVKEPQDVFWGGYHAYPSAQGGESVCLLEKPGKV